MLTFWDILFLMYTSLFDSSFYLKNTFAFLCYCESHMYYLTYPNKEIVEGNFICYYVIR